MQIVRAVYKELFEFGQYVECVHENDTSDIIPKVFYVYICILSISYMQFKLLCIFIRSVGYILLIKIPGHIIPSYIGTYHE